MAIDLAPDLNVLARSDRYEFDLSGGLVCLDFVNTVGGRGAPREHLNTYGDLLAWAIAAGALPATLTRRLGRRAQARPEAARRTLSRLRMLREALYGIFAAAAGSRRPGSRDLAVLNQWLHRVFGRSYVEHSRRGFRVQTRIDPADLAAVAVPVLRSAVEVLTSDVDRVRVCADPTCAWLFLDTTRNRARRWCDMNVCGNRNKVRRFRGRLERRRRRAQG